MPWKKDISAKERAQFVEAALRGQESFQRLCIERGVARSTGYYWWRRYRERGVVGLEERSWGRRPGRKGRAGQRWEEKFLALRRKHPHWGPKKLRAVVARGGRCRWLPSERSIGRWLAAAGLVGRRKQRQRRGPGVTPPQRKVRGCNAVWTVDFKGHFWTGDGVRCLPLTIRDLHSRYLLCNRHVAQPSEGAVQRVMRPIFWRYGLPKVIRVDHGAPFSGVGPLELSALSVWWLRLGISVEFTRRGKPQDNGAHEQMHRVLKAHSAQPPAATLAAQERRLRQFQHYYNTQRPHEALGQRVPAQCYQPSRRRYARPQPLRYGPGWCVRTVSAKGDIKWEGRIRLVGRAFAHQQVGLKVARPGTRRAWVKVYLGRQLIGELHRADPAGMRGAHWRHSPP